MIGIRFKMESVNNLDIRPFWSKRTFTLKALLGKQLSYHRTGEGRLFKNKDFYQDSHGAFRALSNQVAR